MARTTINTQVIPDGTIVSADLSYPLTDFSSTGIDDNASSTSLTIDSSGNITVTGTVDGRDLAADGTKLDGIEASADVTDTANVTAAGALMDSEVTNLAQVKAFSSSDYATAAQGTTADSALQNIVEDTTPQLGGDLASNGSDILFADNDKAIFGAGSDLQIYHDGSNSFIRDAGTGNLVIRGTNLNLQKDGGESYITMVADGAVSLFYDNAAKLATTSTGIDVTGTVTSDGLIADSITNDSGNLAISSTQSISLIFDSNNDQTNREVNILHDSGTRVFTANEDGDISFYEDTGTTSKFFWDASTERLGIGTTSPTDKLNISSGSNQIGLDTGNQATYGTLDVGHFTNGAFIGTQAGSNAQSNVLRLGTSGIERTRLDSSGTLIHKAAAVFNEDGSNSDFRVEGDSNSHLLFVDASENLVTVGHSGGYASLQVVGDTAPSEYRTFFVSSASDITRGVAIAYDYANDVGVITAVDAGTGWKSLRIANTGMTIDRGLNVNDSANSAGDFRVESAGNANMLFVDAGNNRIGMGTNSGTGSLHIKDVRNSGGADVSVVAQNTTSNRITDYRILDESNNTTTKMQYDNGSNRGNINFSVPNQGNGDVGFDGSTMLIASNSSSAKLQLQSSSTDRATFYATSGIVFNEPGNDYDFRVESDSNTHALFVNAGEDTVSIGTSSPPSDTGLATPKLNVSGALQVSSGYYTTLANPNGRVFTLKTAGNGSAAFIKLEGGDYLGYRSTWFRCHNVSGAWSVTACNVVTQGTAPTFTLANNLTANPTITLGFNGSYSGGYCTVNLSPAQFTIS